VLRLPSELTHSQANALLAQLRAGLEAAPAGEPVVVDASALERFDSSALAVLLELRRIAQRSQKTLQVQAQPPHLSDLAKLYGIETLLQ
jgi:phospholipid transport system transporter-binding protein